MPMKTIWIWTPKEDWRSKSFDWLPKVSRKLFYSDTAAGFAAGLVALPVSSRTCPLHSVAPNRYMIASVSAKRWPVPWGTRRSNRRAGVARRAITVNLSKSQSRWI
jgi:hypothetical protein